VIALDSGIRSTAAVRAAVGLEALQELHPAHELFVVWCRIDPLRPYAIVCKISRARIAEHGWPILVDPERRVLRLDPPDPAWFPPPAPEPRRLTHAEREAINEARELAAGNGVDLDGV
jgi:hypothetical protein